MKKLLLLSIFVISSYCYDDDCPKCTFSDNGRRVNENRMSNQCILCDLGTCTPKTGTIGTDKSVCTVQTKLCEAGTYGRVIYKGYDTDGKGENCSKCREGNSTREPGQYSDYYNEPCNLWQCPKNFYSHPELKGYISDFNDCKKCPLGYSTEKKGQQGTDDSVCKIATKKCKVGSYSENGYDLDGNGEGCDSCPDFSTTQTDGTATNSYINDISEACVLYKCRMGTYTLTQQRGFGGRNGKGCIPCPAGRTTVSEGAYGDDAVQACSFTKLCPAGSYSFTQGFDYGRCYKCDENSWSGEGQNYCTPCEENRQSPAESTSVKACKCITGYLEDVNGECIKQIISESSNPSNPSNSSKLVLLPLFIFAICIVL